MAIYLDNSATTKPFTEAAEAVFHFMQEEYYNPSSLYEPAVQVAHNISRVREIMARDMGVNRDTVFFTSGGTEGNNAIVKGVLESKRAGVHAITTSAEHSSVAEAFDRMGKKGCRIDVIDVDDEGRVRQDQLMQALRRDTTFISLMHVNNEVGAINDISGMAHRVHEVVPNCVFHADGVQAYPKMLFPEGVDAYTVSGHKFHAPRGTGAVYIKERLSIEPLLAGGGQEYGMRGGTENSAGIVGMGVALKKYLEHRDEYIDNMLRVKSRLYNNLSVLPDIRINGPAIEHGAPHILNMSFAGVNAETIVHALEEKEIYVGTGSACSSRSNKRSRVLAAMRVPQEFLDGAIRFSLCYSNTIEEADMVAQQVIAAVNHARRFQRK